MRFSVFFHWEQILPCLAIIFVCAIADACEPLFDQSDEATALPPLGFAFAPGGLLFPYYVGVAYQLRDLGMLRSSTPVAGASAGSIAAAAIAMGISESAVRNSTMHFMEDVKNGEQKVVALRRQLEVLFPEDAADLAQRHGLSIGYVEALPHPQKHIVTRWKSKDDLIETVLASCNFPLFLSKWPLVKCRNGWGFDGMFSTDFSRFGCPAVGDRTVAVVAASNVRISFDTSDVIQPGRQGMNLPDDVGDWFQWSISPAPEKKLDEMIALGRAHARAWTLQQCIPEAFKSWFAQGAKETMQGKFRQLRLPKLELPLFGLPRQSEQPHSQLRFPWSPPPPPPTRPIWLPTQWPQRFFAGIAQLSVRPGFNVISIPKAAAVVLFAIGGTIIMARLPSGSVHMRETLLQA